jgi:hypothetical protein
MPDFSTKVSRAIKYFWATREKQIKQQGIASGKKDYGLRGAVTGGAQLNGFVSLITELLLECNIPKSCIFDRNAIIPGYYRPTKGWDLIVVVNGNLLASVEFKSQVGPSFGNNFNNRIEEALGSATDIWTAFREGAFAPSPKPWLGYLMLLEEHPKSITPVKIKEPHFRVFHEFQDSSYTQRYGMFCQKLVRERLYDAACFITSDKKKGRSGKFKEPIQELGFKNFAISLMSKAMAFSKSLL